MSHSHNSNSIKVAFFLNLTFTILEFIGGFLTNSVAILSDAVHDLGDSFSLGLGWWLENYSSKKADDRFSYGYSRFSLLGSLVNALVLILGGIVVLSNALPRLINPQPTHSGGMILLAVVGIIVNGVAAFRLSEGKNENTKVLSWHLIEDVLGWIAVLLGGIIISYTGFYIIDPILSLGITFFIILNVIKHFRSTIEIFLQSIPKSIKLEDFKKKLLEISGIVSEHHTHVWSLDGEHHVLTTHVTIVPEYDLDQIIEIKKEIRILAQSHGFYHVTVEVEFDRDDCSNNRPHNI